MSEDKIDYMDSNIEHGMLELQETDAEMVCEFSVPDATHDIVISGINGVLITMDCRTGDVTFGEHYTLDETARAFWMAVAMINPALVQPVVPTLLGGEPLGEISDQEYSAAREIADIIDTEVLQLVMDEHTRREQFDHAMELLK